MSPATIGSHEIFRLAGDATTVRTVTDALMLARDHGRTSVAFPALSTGIYSYLLQAAAEIAVRTASESAAEARSLTTVHFACFSDEVLLTRTSGLPRRPRPRWTPKTGHSWTPENRPPRPMS
jgi:O-acetyl-ADP-ribose deacetylase (regulator of RNase III)